MVKEPERDDEETCFSCPCSCEDMMTYLMCLPFLDFIWCFAVFISSLVFNDYYLKSKQEFPDQVSYNGLSLIFSLCGLGLFCAIGIVMSCFS